MIPEGIRDKRASRAVREASYRPERYRFAAQPGKLCGKSYDPAAQRPAAATIMLKIILAPLALGAALHLSSCTGSESSENSTPPEVGASETPAAKDTDAGPQASNDAGESADTSTGQPTWIVYTLPG